LEGTSGIIWSNPSWQKHGLDNMAQRPVRLSLKSAQCWGVHCFPGEIIPTGSEEENFVNNDRL